MKVTTDTCPNCGAQVQLVHERRQVPLGQRRVTIDDEFMRCVSCGEQFYALDQAELRHDRAVAQARQEDNLLSPQQIEEIRDSLGLSRPQFEKLLGVGEKTCIRWEKGRVCQNYSTDRLIRLIAANRANAAILAGINGVALPDSCYVPAAEYEPHAVVAWGSVAQAPRMFRHTIRIGATPEANHDFTTKEHEIMLESGATSVAMKPLDSSALLFTPRIATPPRGVKRVQS